MARAILCEVSCFPWYEWIEEFIWEDDEFEDEQYGTISERKKKSKMKQKPASRSI